MCELVYVSSLDTYELLYMNAAGRETYGINNGDLGGKCYEVLQGLSEPCPFCTNSKLSLNKVYTWEITNLKLSRHFLLKDKLIPWSGKIARLEIAFDQTEEQKSKLVLQKNLETERIMIDCVRDLHSQSNYAQAMPSILERVGKFLNAERAYTFAIKDKKMYNTCEWCAKGIPSQIYALQGLDESLISNWKQYFDRHECYIMPDLDTSEKPGTPTYNVLVAQNIHSLVVAPLEKDGELIGYIGVDNPPKENLVNISLLFNTLRYFLVSSIRRTENELLLRRLSYHDVLTGSYNRTRYVEDVKELCAKCVPIGVVYMDLNGLKDINDSHGHLYGDQVIITFSNKVTSIFDSDKLYRVGGDEFIVLSQNSSENKFKSLVLELKKLFLSEDDCSAAMGYHWIKSSSELDEAVSRADAMMYEDKKNYYRRSSLSKRYRHHNDDVLGLNSAEVINSELEKGNFLIYFQPKFDFDGRTLSGAEALIRYRSPNGDIIAPNQFLPLIEELHLISLIDFYVYDYVCAKIASWEKLGKHPIPISINFSRDSISEPNFIERLIDIKEKYKIDKEFLEIEITESTQSMEGFDLKAFIEKMHAAGFAISIDDFGVEYANISLLSSISFDKLKIDKSLIDDIVENEKTQYLMNAISDMCRAINIRTTVEGVETEEQFKILQKMNFTEAQGFLFSRPIPTADFESAYRGESKSK